MKILFEQQGMPGTGKPSVIRYLNLLEVTSEEAIGQIEAFYGSEKGTGRYHEISEDSGWPSWYPVIDYTRCTACGQCADFCLFGVYEKKEHRVEVVHPQGCKNNCPACARICPSVALIFPKYKNGGAIGGADVVDEDAEQQRRINDIESIVGGDLYSALEARKIRRRSIIREEAMNRALSERDNALNGDLTDK